jgi:hypothetical protein
LVVGSFVNKAFKVLVAMFNWLLLIVVLTMFIWIPVIFVRLVEAGAFPPGFHSCLQRWGQVS